MDLQPLARLKIGAAFFTPPSNSVSMPGFTSICAISRIMIGFPLAVGNINTRHYEPRRPQRKEVQVEWARAYAAACWGAEESMKPPDCRRHNAEWLYARAYFPRPKKRSFWSSLALSRTDLSVGRCAS